MVNKKLAIPGYGWLILIIIGLVTVPLLYLGSWLGSLKYLALIAFFAAYATVRSPLAPPEKIGQPLAAIMWMLAFILTLLAAILRQFTGLFEVTAVLFVMGMALGEVFRPQPK